MNKVTKEDVQKVFKSLCDKEKVEEIKQMFYIDSIKGACFKACEVYGFDLGFDLSLDMVTFLLAHDMIKPTEMLDITCELAINFNEKEGENHGKN